MSAKWLVMPPKNLRVAEGSNATIDFMMDLGPWTTPVYEVLDKPTDLLASE